MCQTFGGNRDSAMLGHLSHTLQPGQDLNLGLLTPQSFLFPVCSAPQKLSLTGFALLFSSLPGLFSHCCKKSPFAVSSLDTFQQETPPLTSISGEYSLLSLHRGPSLMISGHLISCSSLAHVPCSKQHELISSQNRSRPLPPYIYTAFPIL